MLQVGATAEWIIDKFEEAWDYEERMEKKIKCIVICILNPIVEELTKPVCEPLPKPPTKAERN